MVLHKKPIAINNGKGVPATGVDCIAAAGDTLFVWLRYARA